jgi:exonuclease SbcC
MKIKKVEIEAFRAFDEISDSTFDFTLKDKSIANFVSIYAPNGFGKTSFYDAVEWGVTGQISRFSKNASENTKVSRENRKNNKNLFLLQHNGQNKPGSVKVISDSITTIFKKKNITNSKVYDFSKEGDNLYFKNVILSQDLIDSFIKVDKADERYKEFVKDIPSLNKYNIGLQNIIRLHENIEEELTGLQNKRERLEQTTLDFDFEGDNKILEEINKSIYVLINNKEELKLIEKQFFTENELAVLTQKVEARISGINSDINSLNFQSESIDNAFNGSEKNENEIGFVKYYSFKEKLAELKVERNSFEKYLKLLKERSSSEKSILDLMKKLDDVIKSNSEILKIKNLFGSFVDIQEKIKQLEKEQNEIKQVLNKVDLEKKILIHSQSDFEIELKKLDTDIASQITKIERIPLNTTRKFEIDVLKENATKEIASIDANMKTDIEKLFKVNEAIKDIDFYAKKLKDNNIDILKECTYLKEYSENLSRVEELNIFINELQYGLTKTNTKIETQKSLNSDLESLILKGLEILNLNEDSICPLCSANYDSYKVLSERITNNPLLEDALKESLKEKSVIEKDINDYKATISEIIQFIEKVLTNKLELEVKSKQNLIGDIEKKKLSIEGLNLKIKDLNDENEILITFWENLSPEAFEKKIKADVQFTRGKIDDVKKKREIVSKEVADNYALREKSTKRLDEILKDIKSIENLELYKSIISFFSEVLRTSTIEIDVLESKFKEITNEEVKINDEITSEKNKIEDFNILLKDNSLHLDQLEIQNKLKEEEIDKIAKTLKNFEVYINSDYKIDLHELIFEESSLAFEQKKNSVKNKLYTCSEILKHYQIVEKLKDNSYKFLVSEKTKANIDVLGKEISILDSINKKLGLERNNIEVFLKKAVDNFFYTDIINSIYSKIDPHPDYDKIEFDCDFKEKSPRLQIYTIDKDGNKSIPSLYFSSAQVNILSLSIFLARALKTINPETNETVKCIFVDDPIQSMDSINVLSFIDLFRSLSVNLDRQIVVSTHEENFHLLLQKKIPEKLFKSKFIQFETFGKLEKMEKE